MKTISDFSAMIAQLTFDRFMHSFAECTPLQCSVMRIVVQIVADLWDAELAVDHFLRSAFLCLCACMYVSARFHLKILPMLYFDLELFLQVTSHKLPRLINQFRIMVSAKKDEQIK